MDINLEPSVQIKITGTQITNLDTTSTFTLDNKDEYSFEIQSVSSPVSIPLNRVPNTKLIHIHGTGDYTLTFTTAVGAFVIPCTGSFLLNTSQAFITSLVSLTCITASRTMIKVFVDIYGKDTV
jgi:hypothetical protein